MTENEKQEVALFRYSILSPCLQGNDEYGSLKHFFTVLSAKSYDFKGKKLTFASGTIEQWYYAYKKRGFDGLKPAGRSDAGVPRKMNEDIEAAIRMIIDEYPRIPSTVVYSRLIDMGIITKKELSLSSLTRYVSSIKAQSMITNNKDMRRYERAHINEVWCGDSTFGLRIDTPEGKKKAVIIALIDDASRMIVGIDIFFNDNYVNLMSVIKSAVTKYGIPYIFNFDNGKNYRNRQISLLSAKMGSNINYCAPYVPESKSKIERFFRTLKDHWFTQLNAKDTSSIESARESLFRYIDEYNHTVHSSLNGKCPKERFFDEQTRIRRLNETQIHDYFLLEIERKVSRDSVVMIDQVEYEVHYRYAGKRITLRYTPDMKEVYVVDGDKMIEIKLLNKIENSTIKREKIRISEGEY